MWKIYHKIFGWDYIAVLHHYSYDIVKLKKAPNGTLYYGLYGRSRFVDLDKTDEIVWLTCAPSKYFPDSK